MILQLNLRIPWEEVAITSDPHYHHKNLVKGVSSWNNKDGCRDFPDLETYNDTLVRNINKAAKGKILICLGDWSFGGIDKIEVFRKRLQAKEVHLIVGNHDHHLVNNTKSCRKHFTSVNAKGVIQINGQWIILNHFPEYRWYKARKGAWMLHGDSHGTIKGGEHYLKSKIMDVGLDTHPKFRPYLGTEIKDIMARKKDAPALNT